MPHDAALRYPRDKSSRSRKKRRNKSYCELRLISPEWNDIITWLRRGRRALRAAQSRPADPVRSEERRGRGRGGGHRHIPGIIISASNLQLQICNYKKYVSTYVICSYRYISMFVCFVVSYCSFLLRIRSTALAGVAEDAQGERGARYDQRVYQLINKVINLKLTTLLLRNII